MCNYTSISLFIYLYEQRYRVQDILGSPQLVTSSTGTSTQSTGTCQKLNTHQHSEAGYPFQHSARSSTSTSYGIAYRYMCHATLQGAGLLPRRDIHRYRNTVTNVSNRTSPPTSATDKARMHFGSQESGDRPIIIVTQFHMEL